ncbi:HD-GYP domain-containing protein [Thalassobaculum litoreum]|uniref:Putative two-component system response regulator n=1 Tax=Thalassobaculum litoreum DSM 18839 TaxID=1123362 RepID=A0A8G2BMT3_9PROT|nr:HD domain-containing phosphohydrolase [Thalassobaculum litoreum]SDG59730.1 putative two-component system response regulator [Thalassobaculum litoreum DSM 18839]
MLTNTHTSALSKPLGEYIGASDVQIRENRGRHVVLIVDDDPTIRELLRRVLTMAGYRTATADGGLESLAAIDQFEGAITAVVTDVSMPGLDGLGLIGAAAARKLDQGVQFYLMSGAPHSLSMARTIGLPISGTFQKPLDIVALVARLDADLLAPAKVEDEIALDGIGWLGRALAHHDKVTGAHSDQVARYTAILSGAMGLPVGLAEDITSTSVLHDIGKIGISDMILNKPAPLTDDEFAVIRRHGEIGHSILTAENHRLSGMASQIARHHHERFDGTGYNRLAGYDIPLPARIVALTDVYDALRSPRPYKPALTHEEAVSCILKGDGRTKPEHFDPAVLSAFEGIKDVFERVDRHD